MKTKWLNIAQYQKVFRFLGPKVTWAFLLSVFVGVAYFFIEICFGFSLQVFFQVLGITPAQSVKLPSWFPSLSHRSIFLFLIVLACFRGSVLALQTYLQNSIYEEFRYHNRKRILSWLFSSPSMSTSRLLTLYDERVTGAATFIQAFQTIVLLFTTSAFLAFFLFHLNFKLTLAGFVGMTVLGPLIQWLNRKVARSGRGTKVETEKLYRRLLMSVKNLLLLRIYGMENREEAKIQESLNAYRKHILSQHLSVAGVGAVPQILGVGIICVLSAFAMADPSITPTLLLTYFYLFIRFVQNTSVLIGGISNFVFNWPQAADLAAWWIEHSHDSVRKDQHPGFHPEKIEKIETLVGWNLENVSFQYPKAVSPTLQSLNIRIPEGAAFLITGPSGVGKSTLVNLLLGEVPATKGAVKVCLNGKEFPIESVKTDLLHQIGYVGPESFLVEGTVLQNLTYGYEGPVDPDFLKDCIQQAECQFIYNLKDGLDHPLTDQGHGLSAGQKQRLSLVRALLRKPKALILDEATSNLDYLTESKLVETFHRLKGKMTLVVITHRETLVGLADQRLEMK
jgi:ABC-type multidrug transport system fused ATPase/permease subunit